MSNKTDVPALSAGAVAGSISIFIESGPFHPLNIMISITLLSLIFAYVARNIRDYYESIAFSLISSFVFLPIVGVICEWKLGSIGAEKSQVSSSFLLSAWLIAGIILYLLDRYLFQLIANKALQRTSH